MFKKITSIITLLSISMLSFGITNANEDFNVVNNSGKISISQDSILVGKVDRHTSIIDLFSELLINNTNVTDDIINAIDVRYVTAENVDYKVNSDLDIIDNGSTVYVLFKTRDNDGFVIENTNNDLEFTLKNLVLNEIGVVSEMAENSYNTIYNVVYNQEVNVVEEVQPIMITPEPILSFEEPMVDNIILETNETGIYSNYLILFLSFVAILFLLFLPLNRKIN